MVGSSASIRSHTSPTWVVEQACDYEDQLYYLIVKIRVHKHARKNKEL